MSADSYDFYDDDWFDGAATMTVRGRKQQLERIFESSTYTESDDNAK